MEKRSIKEWVARACILMVGLTIAHLGVTLFLLSDLGADPFNVFVQGIFRNVDTIAPVGFILGGIVGAGTLVCIALVGPVAGIFLPINEKLVENIIKMLARH